MRVIFFFLITMITLNTEIALGLPTNSIAKKTISPFVIEPSNTAVCAPTPTPKPIIWYPSECDEGCPNGITIKCHSGYGYQMWVEKLGDCNVNMGSDACDMFGFTSGGKYSLMDIRDKTQCQSNPKVDTGTKAYYCCGVRHEMYHACDKPGASVACSEARGNGYSASCMNTFTEGKCSNPYIGGQIDCYDICYTALISAINKTWDQCNCDISNTSKSCGVPFDINACCNCTTKCDRPEKIMSLIPASCAQYISSNKTDWAIKHCKSMPNAISHSCSYMNDGDDGTFSTNFEDIPLCKEVPVPTPIKITKTKIPRLQHLPSDEY